MEVKAHASCNAQKVSTSTAGIQETACSSENSSRVTLAKSLSELKLPSESTPKTEVQELSYSVPNSCELKKVPENAVSLKTSVSAGSALDIFKLGSENDQHLTTPIANPVDGENNHDGDHAPLKMKIMASNAAAGKKLSCILNAAFSSNSETFENKQATNSSSWGEPHGARLSTSVKRHSQTSLTHQARQMEVLGNLKDSPAIVFPVHMAISSDSARTARKTMRVSSEHGIKDSVRRDMVDPDIGHCDIVFIDKPITECFKKQRRGLLPRRNARKSTRGHMYSDEIWELKTVRTLARRGDCPNPMPELITLITPKRILTKPEGVPPVDLPFAGACKETMNRQPPTEESNESVIPGAGDVEGMAASKVDVVVETSLTDVCRNKEQSGPASPLKLHAENQETFAEQEKTAELEITAQSEESVDHSPRDEATKENEPEPQKVISLNTEQTVSEAEVEPVESDVIEEAEPPLSSDKLANSEPDLQQSNTSSSPMNQVEEEMKEDKEKNIQNVQHQELQSATQTHPDSVEVTEKLLTTGSAEELIAKPIEVETPQAFDSSTLAETKNNDDDDASTKALDAPLKESPPSRRKKATKRLLAESLKLTETVVGYVNGKPVSASDRSLRHRAGSNPISPSKTPVKSSQNVPNSTVPDLAVDLPVENQKMENPSPETHMPLKLVESPLEIQQVTEPSPETSSTQASKSPLNPQKIHCDNNVQKNSLPVPPDQPPDQVQNTTPKRPLRSAREKPLVTPASVPTSSSVPSFSSPKPSTLILPLAEQIPLLLPYPLSVTASSLNKSAEPSASEQPQQEPETVESNIKNTQSTEAVSEDVPKSNVPTGSETKQKLRSTKAVTSSENEKQQISEEESNSLESRCPFKTELEMEPVSVRGKRGRRRNGDVVDVALIPKKKVLLDDKPADGDSNGASVSDKPTRMPLRSETSKAEMPNQSVNQSPPADNKKLALRSQRLTAPSASSPTETSKQNDASSPVRTLPERTSKSQGRPSSVSVTSFSHNPNLPLVPPKHEPPKQTTNKFFETLMGEESQHLITNLNNKYDKLLKSWVQMDKEGQPPAKYKNKSDRQAAIWKSKRRARKSKSSEHQKYSPVQMLFMKGFNLTSICRWFLETTETKSLVIVKNVNTRHPSETQLCFHSSAAASGPSQGVFPSLQAERLKKHLKKFAIASPVKSNPKSLKLIAKALEQEANAVKGKERDVPSYPPTPSKASDKACAQKRESKKSSGNKNPASARILRKYSNIREKMQVQQTTVRLKEASKMLTNKKMKTLTAAKSAKAKLEPSLKGRKSVIPISKQMKESTGKLQRTKILTGKKSAKRFVQKKAGKAPKTTSKKQLPKRSSQRLGSPKISEQNSVDTSKIKVTSKKQSEADKAEVEKCEGSKASSAKIQTKDSSPSVAAESKGCENAAEIKQQNMEVKSPASPDQVLTRSQRKLEAAAPLTGSPGHASKRAKKPKSSLASPKVFKEADEPKLTRSGALKRSQTSSLPRSVTKGAPKRAQRPAETPAKRTRTK